MHAARRQHRYGVEIFLAEKSIDVIERRHAEVGGDGVGALTNFIAHGNQFGSGDMAAPEKIGMAFRDASTPQQAKLDHASPFVGSPRQVARWVSARPIRYRAITQQLRGKANLGGPFPAVRRLFGALRLAELVIKFNILRDGASRIADFAGLCFHCLEFRNSVLQDRPDGGPVVPGDRLLECRDPLSQRLHRRLVGLGRHDAGDADLDGRLLGARTGFR